MGRLDHPAQIQVAGYFAVRRIGVSASGYFAHIADTDLAPVVRIS